MTGASITLNEGEAGECTITNTMRAHAEVSKTFEGGAIPSGESFTFEIRKGASEALSGIVLSTLVVDSTTAFPASFSCDSGASAADCQDNSSGVGQLAPGTYQFCEVGMLAGYSNDLVGWTPDSENAEGGDNSSECVNFTVAAGETASFEVNNEPPPGGDARTIGFWKNWTSCDGHGNQAPFMDEILLAAGGFTFGDLFIDTCPEAVDILDKRLIGDPTLVGDAAKVAGDAAYGLAAQFLAALLNEEAGAVIPAGWWDKVNEAYALLANGDGDKCTFTFDGQGSYLPGNKKASDLPKNCKRSDYNALRQYAEGLAGYFDSYNNNE